MPTRWVAWLALAAMWLLVAAPTVSRTLPSLWFAPDLGAWCTGQGLSDHHAGAPEAPDHGDGHTDSCGYCVLLAHSPLLGGAPALATVVPNLPDAPVFAWIDAQGRALPLLSAHPRGPPSMHRG